LDMLSAADLPAAAPLLLVSVINLAEAQAAFEGDADVIDIKNPAEGALGAPLPGIIADICRTYKGIKPVSVALGEFPGKTGAAALAALGAAQFRPDYLKIAFCAEVTGSEIVATLQEIRQGIMFVQPEGIPLVAVVYADTLPCAAWTLKDFVTFVQEGGAQGCLIDTWEKKGISLPQFLSRQQTGDFIADCHERRLFCGLAGSLKPEDIDSLLNFKPDLIGVRSAVCGGDRLHGKVTPARVEAIKVHFIPKRETTDGRIGSVI